MKNIGLKIQQNVKKDEFGGVCFRHHNGHFHGNTQYFCSGYISQFQNSYPVENLLAGASGDIIAM